MTPDEYEAETLARAVAGDAEARREAIVLAADALSRGAPLSAPLRAWLADALVLLLCALRADAHDLAGALATLGFESNPAHRPTADDAPLRRLEIAAAVAVLAALPSMNKTCAVESVAQALPSSNWAVWQACKGVDDWPDAQAAAPVFARMRVLMSREPLAYCGEVRDFLKVTE